MMLSLTRKNGIQKLGAFLLACSQVFWAVGCRQTTGPGSGGGAAASTAAGATTGVNVGLILYNTLHHKYETAGETAKVLALEARRDEFIVAVNRILPADVSSNLFPTLVSLLPLVDDGRLEAAVADVDGLMLDLLADRAALEGLTKLLAGAPTPTASGRGSRATHLLLSRLLAYPQMESLAKALLQVVEANDGVDANGQPNGERNMIRELQAMASRQLLAYQPTPNTSSTVTQTLEKLAAALLSNQPLQAFPDLGAPAWAVRMDVHGNPKVLADPATGALPVPFVDRDADGAADVDGSGRPVDAAGAVIDIAPFGADGTRDSYGRALAPGGGLYYTYYDAKRTLLSEVLLLGGEVVSRDVPGEAVIVIDGLTDRVSHDNGTIDPSDDYVTLSPDSPFLDLTHANFELVKRSPLPKLLSGTAEIVKRDPQKFGEMVDSLLVSMKRASSAASTVPPAPGGGQALMNDMLPMLEDTLRPRGQNTSAMRALLQAFNTKQRQLRTLPPSFAKMMKFHDFRNRIPADATHKSVMHRILDMMVAANQCSAPFMGNMAEFYLKAMAGTQRILGISINTGTIHLLLSVGFLRSLLCSGIKADDVRALKDFDDTGALDAMKPIARVFADRGEIRLLKDIMLGLQRHYETVMRPTEPTAVAILESGSVEKLFEVIDAMTQVQVPGSGEVVADVLADTLQALVSSAQPVHDRRGVPHRTLAHLMLAPMDALSQKAQQRGVTAHLDNLFSALGDVVMATYNDDRGTTDPADDVERWKWQGLKGSLGDLLSFAADAIPTDPTARAQWATDQQREMEHLLTGRDLVLVIDLLKGVASSPQKAVITQALTDMLTPNANAANDVFGALLTLVADSLAHKPNTASAVDQQALADVLHFVGRSLDPLFGKMDGVVAFVRGVIAADEGLLLLRVARNAFDKGPNGVDDSALEVLQRIFDEVGAAGGPSGPMTVADVEQMLNDAHAFVIDRTNGLTAIILRIKNRPR